MSSSSPLSFEQVTDQFNWVRRLAVDLCGEDRADDVAQETMFRALEAGAKHDRNLRGWLATIARNVVAGEARKEGRRKELLFERLADLRLDESPETAAEEVLARSEASRLVLECVNQLPREYRVAALMHYQEDLSFAEIAVALDATEKTIRHRISRAQDKIRDMLRQRHGDQYLLPAAALVPRSAFLKKPFVAPFTSGSAISSSSFWAAAALAVVSISAFLIKGPAALRVFGAERASALAVTTPAAANDTQIAQPPITRVSNTDDVQLTTEVDRSTWIWQPFIIADLLGHSIVDADTIVTDSSLRLLQAYSHDPASASPNNSEAPIFRTRSDGQGRVWVLAPPNSEYTIWVRKHGFLWKGETLAHVGDQTPHTLRLSPAATVTLQVSDSDSELLAGALAHVFHLDERYDWLAGTLQTDEQGSVTIGYAPGPIVVQVYAPGHVHHVINLEELQIGDHLSLSVQLRKGNSRSGRIVDSLGRPVVGARVHVVPEAANQRGLSAFPMQRTPDAVTDENGEFEVDSIPVDGRATLRIFKPGWILTEIPANELPVDGDIVLERHPEVDLQVLARGVPAFPAVVNLSDMRGNFQSFNTDQQGRVHVGGDGTFAAGEVVAQIDSLHGSLQTTLRLDDAANEPVKLDLAQEHSLQLDLIDGASMPIAGAPIQLIRQNSVSQRGDFSRSAVLKLQSDQFGKARCFVQPGDYQVLVKLSGGRRASRLVTVGVDAQQRVEIRLSKGVQTQFALASFDNADGAMLHLVPLTDSSLTPVWVPFDSSGNTPVRWIAPAKYQALLYARKPGYGESLTYSELPPVEIHAGQEGVVQLNYDPRELIDTTLVFDAHESYGEAFQVELRAISEEQVGHHLVGKFVASENYRVHDRSMPVVGWPAGWYRASIRDANGKRGAQRDVLLQPGLGEVVVSFTETPLLGRLSATWLEQLGEDQSLRLNRADGTWLARVSIDANGGFEIDHLVAGQYVLSSRDGLLTYPFELGPQVNGARDLGVISPL